MALKFDATSKAMFRIDREAWLDLSETPPDGAVEDVNVDLSAISASADNIVKIKNKKQPWAAIFEFASSYQKALLAKMAMRHHLVHLILEGLPVETILILMDKRAGQARFTGTYGVCVFFVGKYSSLYTSKKTLNP